MEIIQTLKLRFNENKNRHENTKWEEIEQLLLKNNDLLKVITKMEETSGEPDVVVIENTLYYVDFSKESPLGRRSLCYDKAALDKRKQNKPISDTFSVANTIGVELLTEEEYYYLQSIEPLDLKTSSWVLTNEEFRSKGGAKFCERRYDEVFTFHNGAESYYSSRGFRGKIKIK